MGRSVLIRAGGIGDLNLLCRIGRATFLATYGDQNDPEEIADYVDQAFSTDALRKELLDARSSFLIAFTGEKAVGYAKVREGAVPECVQDPTALEIERIYVDQSVQGKGYGRVLMSECLAVAKERGGRTAWLGVWERNESAIGFYERVGFEKVGVKTFDVGGDIQTDVVMVTSL